MKKLGLFVCALAAMAMSFTACNDGNGGGGGGFDPSQIVDDGMYVIGEAVGVTDMTKAANLLMAAGVNERLMDVEGKTWTEAHRKGMYEKYLYLEANKKFMLVLLDGDKTTNYGGELAAKEIVTDMGKVSGYWCALQENVDLVVPVKGLYHIVLDLNQNGGDLDGAGGAQIIVTPVNWGVSGGMNGWTGPTLAESVVEKDGVTTWTWTNQEMPEGSAFKFKDEHGWKIWLDGETQQISAHSNLGAEMKNGGNDIPVAEGGLYTFVLNFKLAKGDISNSFTYTVTKTGEIVVKDFSECELELVGAAVDEQEGAVPDPSAWNWGNVLSLGKPTKAGDVFTWKKEGVLLKGLPNGFKVRTINDQPQGDIANFNIGMADGPDGNAYVNADGLYTIIVNINGKTQAKELQVFAATEKGITVTGIVPEGWTVCNLYAWDDNDQPLLGAWPGTALEINEGKVSYTFSPSVKSVNIIFNNGSGAQTKDIKGVVGDYECNISAELQ